MTTEDHLRNERPIYMGCERHVMKKCDDLICPTHPHQVEKNKKKKKIIEKEQKDQERRNVD